MFNVMIVNVYCYECQCFTLREEAIKKAELLFQALDADGDGSLTQVSIAQYYISLYLGWETHINISSGWAIICTQVRPSFHFSKVS